MSTMVAYEATSTSDLISNLPDDVLRQILSRLQLEDIIATTFLSRRWRNFWTSFPVLDFHGWPPEKVTLALVLYNAPAVHTFRFCSQCVEPPAPPVDSWIQFAVRHNVRVLAIGLSRAFSQPNLHSSVYSCKSLEELELKSFFRLKPPPSVSLTSLKTLRLYRMTLDAKELDVLTSGCPVLEDMHLGECNQLSLLKIYISNSNLKRLCVQDDVIMSIEPPYKNELELFAPRLQSLTITGKFREGYVMKNTASLASASFDFKWYQYNEGDLEILVGLLRGVSRVKSLKLSNRCIQVLCLREIKGENPLRFSCTQLELTLSCNWHLLGMVYLLKSSKHLEDLVLNTDDDNCSVLSSSVTLGEELETARREFLEDKFYFKKNLELENLKTIKINEFMGRRNFFMTGLESMSIDKFIEEKSEDIELVQVLLKKCNMLEKMVVRVTRIKYFHELESRAELIQILSKRFQLLPTASPHANILVI